MLSVSFNLSKSRDPLGIKKNPFLLSWKKEISLENWHACEKSS
jgi:hypothetical protein